MTRNRWTGIAATLIAAAAVLVSAPADAQYNSKNGGDFIQEVSIRVSPGDRVNTSQQLNGWIGVQKCRDLLEDDGQVRYIYNRNPQLSNRQLRVQSAYLMEIDPDEGLPDDRTCNWEEDNGCRRINPDDYDGVWIEDEQWPYEVRFDFDVLLEFHDGLAETCEFAESSTAMFAPNVPLSSHGAETTDAGSETGDASSEDAGGGGDETTGGASASYSGNDRAYIVRLFLEGDVVNPNTGFTEERRELADAPLIFDRTRPPPPTDIRAGATERILQVEFTPPTSGNRLDSYHVFYSTSAFPNDADPETLAERDDVWRSGVGRARNEESTRRGTVRNIDQEAGTELWLAVASRDTSDNFSTFAKLDGTITVRKSLDPWEQYRQAGGTETGGCGCRTARGEPTGFLFGLLAMGILGLMRHRRRSH